MSGGEVPVAFGRALRRAGLAAPTGSIVAFAEALAALGLTEPARVRAAARATLLSRPEDARRFDACFDAFFYGISMADAGADASVAAVAVAVDDDTPAPAAPVDRRLGPRVELRFSPHEVLRTKDFGACTEEELEELHRAMHGLHLVGARRRSRRRAAAGRGGPDVRRTMRAALRTGAEPVHLARSDPSSRTRRVVLLLDVSGSMEPYSRALLRFAHAAVVARGRVEVFALGTRLTRLTRELATHDPDVALQQVGGAVVDWAGGTRLGEALRAFNDRWGVRGMARGAVVVILSDGWDRGDPTVLGGEVERLGRVAFRVVWANPLKATPGYAPLAAGMAAALPHVDAFVEGHALSSMEHLAEVIAAS